MTAFLERPIEGDWPYLWIDATYVKARAAGRIVSMAVIVAVGVHSDGWREVLGMDIGPSEAETFWTAFLRKLARRGLRGVKLVVSDAHEGIKAAIAKGNCQGLCAAGPFASEDEALAEDDGELRFRFDPLPRWSLPVRGRLVGYEV